MNTIRKDSFVNTPFEENVIINEDLEYNFTKSELKEITELNQKGYDYVNIAKVMKRRDLEVLWALVHQARKGFLLGYVRGM